MINCDQPRFISPARALVTHMHSGLDDKFGLKIIIVFLNHEPLLLGGQYK